MNYLKVIYILVSLFSCCPLVVVRGENDSSLGGPKASGIFVSLDTIARESATLMNIEILRKRGPESSAQTLILPDQPLRHVDRAYIDKVIEANRILHAEYSSNIINIAATMIDGVSNPLDYKLSKSYMDSLPVLQWIGIVNSENPDLRMVCLDANGVGEKTVFLELASGSTIRAALNQLSTKIGMRWAINVFSTSKQFEISTSDNQGVQAVIEGPRSEIVFIKMYQHLPAQGNVE